MRSRKNIKVQVNFEDEPVFKGMFSNMREFEKSMKKLGAKFD